MEKYLLNGIALLLALLGIAGVIYNYHVEVNVLSAGKWAHSNIKSLIVFPLLYIGSFWLLNIATSGKLQDSFEPSVVGHPNSKISQFINRPIVAKVFIITLVYLGLATFAWAAYSDAQHLLTENV